MKSKVENRRWKISRPDGSGIRRRGDESTGQDYLAGMVATPHGYVEIYSETGLATLRFIHAGAMHCRIMRCGYTPRGLTTLAARFAAEITKR